MIKFFEVNSYELLILTKVGIDEGSIERVRDGIVRECEGKVSNFRRLSTKKLAYPIDHIKEGTYFVLEFQCMPARIQKIWDFLRYCECILRFLIKRKERKGERVQ